MTKVIVFAYFCAIEARFSQAPKKFTRTFDRICNGVYALNMQNQSSSGQKRYWWQPNGVEAAVCSSMPKSGDDCPMCRKGKLAYDGLFLLTCLNCDHIAESGGFT